VVSKGAVELPADLARVIGIDPVLLRFRDRATAPGAGLGTAPTTVPFTPLIEIEKAVTAAIAAVDFEGMARRAAEGGLGAGAGANLTNLGPPLSMLHRDDAIVLIAPIYDRHAPVLRDHNSNAVPVC
jgi:hypothetical protein